MYASYMSHLTHTLLDDSGVIEKRMFRRERPGELTERDLKRKGNSEFVD